MNQEEKAYTVAKRTVVKDTEWLEQVVIIGTDINRKREVTAFDIDSKNDHLKVAVEVLEALGSLLSFRNIYFLKEEDSFARTEDPNWEFYSKAPDTIISMETLLRYRLGLVKIEKTAHT